MKINFTEEEKNLVLGIIKEYDFIGSRMEYLNTKSKEIQNEVDECTKKIDELKNREVDLIGKLRDKYGKFSLQDISDTLYGY